MRLTDFFPSEIVKRDAEFFALGLSNSDPGAGFLSFLDDEKYFHELTSNESVRAVLCREKDASLLLNKTNWGIATSDNPRSTFFTLHNKLSEQFAYYPELRKTIIGKDCKISRLSSLAEYGVLIGNGVCIEDFVRIEGPCIIGDNSVLHSGSIIGSKGFEFKRFQESVLDVVHCGSVMIGSNVEIWENVTIHKAVYPWDSTTVGSWTRIGAHTHIDHGAKISNFVEICASCTISGRTIIGDHAFVGPGATISNRVRIGENSRVLIGSVVTKDVENGKIVSGNFAIPHDRHLDRVIADSHN